MMDQDLQNKLEKIKKNLKDNQSSGSNPKNEDQISKLEEVLKRQKDRLDKSQKSYQSQSYADPVDYASGNIGVNSKTSGSQVNLEQAYSDLEKEIREIKSKLERSIGGNKS